LTGKKTIIITAIFKNSNNGLSLSGKNKMDFIFLLINFFSKKNALRF
jgi:hypothetical protein